MQSSKHSGQRYRVDYFFMRSGPQAPLRTCMPAVDPVWCRSLPVALQGKGRKEKCAVKMLEDFCQQVWLERAFLQTDPENAAIDNVNVVCEKLTHLVPRQSSTNSKGSQGEVERHHRSIEGDALTLQAQVREKYGFAVPTDHPIFDWAVRHQHRDYRGQTLPFDETVMWRDPKGSSYNFASAGSG